MSPIYSFVTHWRVKAPVEDVWNAIYLSEKWPQWWKDVVYVKEAIKGDENGIGSIRSYKLRSPMLYSLEFDLLLTERKDNCLLKGIASGELTGSGEWHFEQQGDVTDVKCYWNVSSTLWWMNAFAFLLRPIFSYNHRIVMKNGGASLSRKLNVPVSVLN